MIASVYIKDGTINFYNESDSLSEIGGLAYELGRPLLDFVCYEPKRFDESFDVIAEVFENEYAHLGMHEPDFVPGLKQMIGELQHGEVYLFFYGQIFMDFMLAFIDSPRRAIEQLSEKIPNAAEKLCWALDYEWPVPPPGMVRPDKEKRLFRAVKDVAVLMSEHLRRLQAFIKHEVEILIHYRSTIKVPAGRSIDYIDILDEYHDIKGYGAYYLEKPFRTFYGRVDTKKVEQLYVIDSIDDLFRFEFVKMIEHDIFIKKCKNCEHFFIPKRRTDAVYCDRIYGNSGRKCTEVGAMMRYEKKVAENPILEAHKKAYRRFNSRTRTKKMTQSEFMLWSEEAAKKRDECLTGALLFDEFVAWLEQGRIRKTRQKKDASE